MRGIERLRAIGTRSRPQVRTAFLTYIDIPAKLAEMQAAEVARDQATPSRYRFVEVTSPADPELAFAPRWQRRLCRTEMGPDGWYCLVARDEASGSKVGHVWATPRSVTGWANGIMNVRLATDEVYVWDLFIDPAHRNMALSQEMGEALVRTFDARGKRWGLTHVLYDNAASVMWHHLFGFDVAQVFNFVRVGERFLWKVPFGEAPRDGPLSASGRHSRAEPGDPFGFSFVPSPDHEISRVQLRGLRRRGRTG